VPQPEKWNARHLIGAALKAEFQANMQSERRENSAKT